VGVIFYTIQGNSDYTYATIEKTHMPKPSGSYSTSDLSRKSGEIIAEALRHPVTITQRNKPRLVEFISRRMSATEISRFR
jgi:hypothetical protein